MENMDACQNISGSSLADCGLMFTDLFWPATAGNKSDTIWPKLIEFRRTSAELRQTFRIIWPADANLGANKNNITERR